MFSFLISSALAASVTINAPQCTTFSYVGDGVNTVLTCNGTTVTNPPVTPPVTPPRPSAISCAGFTKTVVVDIDWNKISSQQYWFTTPGDVGPGDAVVYRFTIPANGGPIPSAIANISLAPGVGRSVGFEAHLSNTA